MSWFGDAYNFIIGSADAAFLPGSAITGSGEQQAAQGGAGVEASADALGAIWADLSNGKLWRSLGWLLLGIVLMLLGLLLWIGPSAARRSPAGIATQALG